MKTQNFILRNTAAISLMNLLGIVSGLVLDAVVLAYMGLGEMTDAFFACVTLPLAILTIVSLFATKVLQPMFIRIREEEGERRGWELVNVAITVVTLAVLGISALSSLLSVYIVQLQVPGYGERTLGVAVRLNVVTSFITPLLSGAAALCAISNALKCFVIPGSLKMIENVARVLTVALLSKRYGIMSLAYGYIVGSVFEVLFVYIQLRKKGYRYRPILKTRGHLLKRLLVVGAYPILGNLAGAFVQIFQNYLASFLGPGNLSALRYATRLVDSFAGVTSQGVILVTLPLVSGKMTKGDLLGFKDGIKDGLGILLLLTVPVCAWLAVLNKPLISVLFERSAFTRSDAELIAYILLPMIPYILLSRLMSLFETGFFAEGDTRTPFLNAIVLCVVQVVLVAALFSPLKVLAFPFSRCLSYLFSSLLILYLLAKKYGTFRLSELKGFTLELLLATAALSLATYTGTRLANSLGLVNLAARLAAIVIPTALGSTAFMLTAMALKMLRIEQSRIRFDVIRRSERLGTGGRS